MAVEIVIKVEGSATSAGTYKVIWSVVSATEMPSEIFRHRRETNYFDGVIQPADLAYPTTPQSSHQYYRTDTGVGMYETITEAEAAKVNIANAISDLVKQYKNNLTNFLVPTTDVYS